MKANQRPVEILLVEDNQADARLLHEAFRGTRIPKRISQVADGEDALAYLRRVGRYAETPRPDLILLDLNLHKKDGREVLAEIKADPELRRIPVVVLSTSADEKDIEAVADLHANAFITKPVELARLFAITRAIDDFWFDVAARQPGR